MPTLQLSIESPDGPSRNETRGFGGSTRVGDAKTNRKVGEMGRDKGTGH